MADEVEAPLVRLRQILDSRCQIPRELFQLLDSVLDGHPENVDIHQTSAAMLSLILDYLKSSPTDQELDDSVLFGLPRALCKFSGLWPCRYLTVVDDMIEEILLRSCPEFMFAALCQAFQYEHQPQINMRGYVCPLFRSLTKVLNLIQRHYLADLESAVHLTFTALEKACKHQYKPLHGLLEVASDFSTAVIAVSSKHFSTDESMKIRALLCLYTLQILAFSAIFDEDNSFLRQHLLVCLRDLLLGLGVSFLVNPCDSEDSAMFDSFSSFFPLLKGILVVNQLHTELQEKAYGVFELVFSEIPASLRLEMLDQLIRQCKMPSMNVGFLLNCLWQAMIEDIEEQKRDVENLFWNGKLVDLVCFTMRPSSEEPHYLHEQVLSALCLFEFILDVLISGSAGTLSEFRSVLASSAAAHESLQSLKRILMENSELDLVQKVDNCIRKKLQL